MPIACPIQFRLLTESEFKALDYQVMQHVFASHNELGRLHDERIYQSDVKARLLAAGLGPVETEVPLTVSWKTFHKTYRLDRVVQNALLHEDKAAAAIVGEFKAQLLNYVLLLGLARGKLVNFRTASVESEYVSTQLTLEKRRAFEPDCARWRDLTPACATLRETMLELLRDWGAFLELALYREALVHFLGGESQVVQPLQISRDNIPLGKQSADVHAPGIAFRLTAQTARLDYAESHLRRFLSHTELTAFQWVNLNHHTITFTTLTR